MKALQYSTIIIGLILLICSCGGDDPLSTTIIGTTWNLRSIEISGCDDPSENVARQSTVNNCLTFSDEELCDYTLEFLAAGNGTIQVTTDNVSETLEISYSVDDDTNVITICELAVDCAPATINGNSLTIPLDIGDGCIANIMLIEN